ncbi:kinase-like domain-containing protein [Gigaspora margarita]|uniref:Kinase-like domain-containing protein n=1 Tax=Gigaspora margarita TaxID=4874 RepID=A0A8H4B186_GIGMA|nr:kinase-like domain-containing protein [Gigaspora margarita]
MLIYILIKGGHGVVYSAEYRGEYIVFKELQNNKIRTIVNELKQHVAVNDSENVIKFLGITIDSGNRGNSEQKNYMIVLQYANGGTLRDYLQNKINENIFRISWADLISIAEQIIFGLRDLHLNNIVHGDLHPKNILIVHDDNSKFKVVLSDFGSASKSGDSVISIHGKYLTIEYADPQFFIDPEMIEPKFKSDIYGLGVILWELTSGIRPFSKVVNKLAISYLVAQKGKREKEVPGTPSSYVKLYKKCWSTKPKKRPKIEEILRKLEKSKDVVKTIQNSLSSFVR